MEYDSPIRLVANVIEFDWFGDIIVPAFVVAFGIIVRALSLRSDDERQPIELYASGWDLMVAASVIACETLFRLVACLQEPALGAECSNFRRVMANARVTSNEYFLVLEGVQIGSILAAILVTGIVRGFGWRQIGASEWRSNGIGLTLPWIAGLLLLFCSPLREEHLKWISRQLIGMSTPSPQRP